MDQQKKRTTISENSNARREFCLNRLRILIEHKQLLSKELRLGLVEREELGSVYSNLELAFQKAIDAEIRVLSNL